MSYLYRLNLYKQNKSVKSYILNKFRTFDGFIYYIYIKNDTYYKLI